ncbi:MFS transporter [Neobacillus sp. YIM B02564]|uniref:MFS transporter n=1 Tax=Neobacillus paridis TaxID=2803862 RepID=A0ABS1TQL8_9BACI|nr:MFS transporter [Neobacillus paridis]
MKGKVSENKRFLIALLFLGWFISSLDRMFINIAIHPIAQELHLDAASMGIILSIFYLGYTLMQLPGGLLADLFGSKRAIIISITAFSLFAGLSGFAWSLVSLLIIRLIFGLGEGAFPGGATKLMSEHFSNEKRSRVQSILLVAIGLGSFFASIAGAYLITSIGWRNVYFLFGAIGIGIAMIYYFALPSVKEKSQQKDQQDKNIPIKELLRTAAIWKVVVALFGLYTAMWGLISWVPSYLINVRKIDLLNTGIYSALPAISTMLGYLAGGWLVDKVFNNRERLMIIIGNALSAFFIYAMFTAESIAVVVTFQVLAGFTFQIAYMGILSIPLKSLPSSIMGSAFGLLNTGANLAAFVTPAVMGILIKLFDGSYEMAFYYLILGNILSLGLGLTLKNNRLVRNENSIINQDNTLDKKI